MPRIHFPYHNYLGPGSDNFQLEPIDEDDAIARAHDLDYDKANSDKDIFQADRVGRDEFASSFIHSDNWHSLIGAAGLGVKNLVEEHVLGKSVYGMGKRKNTNNKDWAKIKNINKARAIKRQRLAEEQNRDIRDFGHVAGENINADQEVNINDFPDFLQNFISEQDVAEAGPSGTQPREEASIESPPHAMASNNDAIQSPMETDVESPVGGVDALAGAPQGGGGGGGAGGSNDGRQDIYSGAPQPNQHHTLMYGKSYHFTLSNGLSDHRYEYSSVGKNLVAQQRFKHIHGIPWERLLMYMSEGELIKMFNTYTAVKVEEVVCEVYSLGVRLPFVTSATSSSVANANAQYPIGCFHFDRAYSTSYDSTQVNDVINKALGTAWINPERPITPITSSWTEIYNNLSASCTSRDINNPVIVDYPLPHVKNQVPKDVGIYDYVDIKNGTTAYGKCWEKRFHPVNGILYAESTLQEEGGSVQSAENNSFLTPIPGLECGYFMNNVSINERWDKHQHPLPKSYTATKYNMPRGQILNSMVDYMGYHYFGDTKAAPQAMPKFMIGFVNIRNEDNSLLVAKWDIMVKTRIKLSAFEATRDFITRTPTVPPQWFTSQYTQFRYFDPTVAPIERDNKVAAMPTRRPRFNQNYTVFTAAAEENENENNQKYIRSQKKLRHKPALLSILEYTPPVTRSKSIKK